MAPRYRLLAIDVDGTLVNSRDELTETVRLAVGRAVSAGIKVVLCTGRRYSRVLHLVEALGLDVPVITASGALIKRPSDHATLFRAHFDGVVLRRTLALVERMGHQPVLYADTFDDGFDFYCATLDVREPELAEYFLLNPDCHKLLPSLVAEPPEVFAGFAMGTQAQMLDVHHALQRELPGELDTHVLRSPRYTGYMCEIAPHGITKWSGIERLADEWGIEHSAICAVGDDVNDIPMIQAAGLGIAMGNALESVKRAADRIAPAHDEEGLATVVDWLLDGESIGKPL